MSLTHLHMVTYTLHITLYTYFSAVTHSPNHQRRTHSHHITHRHHLGNAMVTLGLRRLGEQVSTLTSGTCPPPGSPSSELLVDLHAEGMMGGLPLCFSFLLVAEDLQMNLQGVGFRGSQMGFSHRKL